MTDRTDSPTWDELDAICKGKSAMDLAEEIWRLRRDGPEDRKDAERYRWLCDCSGQEWLSLLPVQLVGALGSWIDNAISFDRTDATRDNK